MIKKLTKICQQYNQNILDLYEMWKENSDF